MIEGEFSQIGAAGAGGAGYASAGLPGTQGLFAAIQTTWKRRSRIYCCCWT